MNNKWENENVALYLENGSRLRGDVDLNNLDSNIPLVPQSDFAVLNVDSLQGSINVPLNEVDFPAVSFDLGGQLYFQENQQPLAALNYHASYNNGNFGVNALHQPTGNTGSNTAFIGATGFRIDKIKTLNLSYRSATNDLISVRPHFSVLMKLQDSDTLEVPLKALRSLRMVLFV
ncbi:MAG: hypothetical protein U5K71_08980 [Gracilimonas sp.]|nr:hypothetical protein [Gracilimonas sp.]